MFGHSSWFNEKNTYTTSYETNNKQAQGGAAKKPQAASGGAKPGGKKTFDGEYSRGKTVSEMKGRGQTPLYCCVEVFLLMHRFVGGNVWVDIYGSVFSMGENNEPSPLLLRSHSVTMLYRMREFPFFLGSGVKPGLIKLVIHGCVK